MAATVRDTQRTRGNPRLRLVRPFSVGELVAYAQSFCNHKIGREIFRASSREFAAGVGPVKLMSVSEKLRT